MAKNINSWKIKDQRFVAFLDILGFKDYVMRNTLDEVYTRLQSLNELRPDEQDTFKPELGSRLKFTAFSDSIFIFSKDNSVTNAVHFVRYIKRLMRMSFRRGIPLKGAIAYGEIVVDDKNNLFCGMPITDAYILEEDLQYMGIVLHHSAEKYLNEFDSKGEDIQYSLKEISTPFKYGRRVHLNLDYRIMSKKVAAVNMDNYVGQQRYTSSGDARKYIDNTLEVLKEFNEMDIKK